MTSQDTHTTIELPWARSLHWLGDRDAAGASQHAKDKTGCVLYFGTEAECHKFMEWYTGLPSDTRAPVELLACPFCGSEARSGDGFSPMESITYAWCSNSDCYLCDVDIGFTPGEWNTRTLVVSSQAGERRASIARIIDPALFERFDRVAAQGRTAANGRRWEEVCYREAIDRTLAKADDILALTSAPGGMGDLADELMAFHDACTGRSDGGDGEFAIACSSGSDSQRIALRAVLRQAAKALRTAAQSAEVRERTIEECAAMVEKVYCYAPPEVSSGTIAKSIVLALRSLAQAGGKR